MVWARLGVHGCAWGWPVRAPRGGLGAPGGGLDVPGGGLWVLLGVAWARLGVAWECLLVPGGGLWVLLGVAWARLGLPGRAWVFMGASGVGLCTPGCGPSPNSPPSRAEVKPWPCPPWRKVMQLFRAGYSSLLESGRATCSEMHIYSQSPEGQICPRPVPPQSMPCNCWHG